MRIVQAQDPLECIRYQSAEIIGEAELLAKLKTGRPLRIKYGADPSAPDLHLGHTVVLRKLRDLQALGHTVQFLIGDFTGMIGDPTGRSQSRPPLSPEQIQINARTYQEQVFRILDRERTEVVYNSTWLNRMNFSDVIRLAGRYTLARILERDDFEKRYRENRPIGLHELLYPLIQGYDSVVLQTDIELCGTDQIFNCLVGRALQHDFGQEPEVIIAMPLLEGLDGVQKMSKSLGNYVGITDSPQEMFGKIMSIPDELMMKYFNLLTDWDKEALEKVEHDYQQGQLNPRDIKVRLAHQIVLQYHGKIQADKSAEEFDRIFKKSELPENITEKTVSALLLKDGKIWITRLLHETGLAPSRSEAQRMVQQGAVQYNQERIRDPYSDVLLSDGSVLQVGKRKYIRIRLVS